MFIGEKVKAILICRVFFLCALLTLVPGVAQAGLFMLTSDPLYPESGRISVGDDLEVELIRKDGGSSMLHEDKDGKSSEYSPLLIYAEYGDQIRIKAKCAAKWEVWRGTPFYNGKKWLSPLYIVDMQDPGYGPVQIFSGLGPTDNGQEENGIFLDLTYTLGHPTQAWCLTSAPDACVPVMVDEDIKLISLTGNDFLTFDFVPDYNGHGHNRVYDMIFPQGPVEIEFNLIVVNRVRRGSISPLYLFSSDTGQSISIHPYGLESSGDCRWFADCPENTVLDARLKGFVWEPETRTLVSLDLAPDYFGRGFVMDLKKYGPDPVAVYMGNLDYLLGPDGLWKWRELSVVPPPPTLVADESFRAVFSMPPETEFQRLFTVGRHEVVADLPDYRIQEMIEWEDPPTLGSLKEIDEEKPRSYEMEVTGLIGALTETDLQSVAFNADVDQGIPTDFLLYDRTQGDDEPKQLSCLITPLGHEGFLDVGFHEIDMAALTFAAVVTCFEYGDNATANATSIAVPEEFGLVAELELGEPVSLVHGQVPVSRGLKMDVTLDNRIDDVEGLENAVIFYTTRLFSVGTDSELILDCSLKWSWTRDNGEGGYSISRHAIDDERARCHIEVTPAVGEVVNPAEEGFENGIRIVRELVSGRRARFLVEFGVDLVDTEGVLLDADAVGEICMAEVWLHSSSDQVPVLGFVSLFPDPVQPGRFRSGLIDADFIGRDGILPLAGERPLREYRYEFKIRHSGLRLPGELMRREFFLGLPGAEAPILVKGAVPERISLRNDILDKGAGSGVGRFPFPTFDVDMVSGVWEKRLPLACRFGVWKEGRGTVYLKGLLPGLDRWQTSSKPDTFLWDRFYVGDGQTYSLLSDIPLIIPLDFFSFRYLGRYVWFIELLNADTGDVLFSKTGPLVIEP